MDINPTPEQELLLAIAAAWARLERRLDTTLSNIKGITFTEYRMLRYIAASPAGAASRVEVAEALGRTPSGITRALRPLEKLGFVETHKSERDARLALASLTAQGQELVDDATGVINDLSEQIADRAPRARAGGDELVAMLRELAS
ncbi:MAG: winged helix-turn-helix transcriptional regulator [Acidimicrobiales bacterium]|nr:winged helix-turn-helix transcriptional regulator [Acidimicrobiales bacterium]